MPKKKSTKEQLDYKEGVADFKAWLKMNKGFEDRGLHGTDYYVRMVEELEAKVKRLEAKLKRKVKKWLMDEMRDQALTEQAGKASKMVWVTFQKEGMHKYPAALDDPKLATGDWDDVSFLGTSAQTHVPFQNSNRSIP